MEEIVKVRVGELQGETLEERDAERLLVIVGLAEGVLTCEAVFCIERLPLGETLGLRLEEVEEEIEGEPDTLSLEEAVTDSEKEGEAELEVEEERVTEKGMQRYRQ